MLKRRDLLQLAGSAAAFAAVNPVSSALADDQAPRSGPFSHASVIDLAKNLAAKSYSAPSTDLPSPFSALSREAFGAIKAKPEGLIWNDKSSGFVIEPLHRGFVYTSAMQINLVENGTARRLSYDAANFDFGGLRLRTPPTDLDFSGFRVLLRNDQGDLRELAVFQGASFFRSAAPGQILGVTSRGLSIRTADPRGEEFPLFRAVWIEKGSVADNALTISALLDSDSVAGAYRFTIHPGDATIIDVECSLFPRAPIDVFGLATMSATALFSPLDRRGDDDVRDAAAEVTGLQMLTGRGEWIWRPVANRANLQISEFVDHNPKGFGFLQRHRAFDDFYDFAGRTGSCGPRSGSNRSATGATAPWSWSKFPPTTKPPITSSPSGGPRLPWSGASRPISPIASSGAGRRLHVRPPPRPSIRGADASRASGNGASSSNSAATPSPIGPASRPSRPIFR